MKQIYLHGKLGKKFGKNFKFKVDSVEEAVAALSGNFEGFSNYLIDQSESGNQYIILTKNIASIKNLNDFNNCCANQKNYKLKNNSKEIHFVPIAAGAGPFKAIFDLGVALFSFGSGWGAGVATAWAGLDTLTKTILIVTATQVAVSLLSKPPKPPTRQDPVSTKSFLMAGSVNRTAQGVAVPIGYGRLRIGSSNISVNKKCFKLKQFSKTKADNKDHLESYMNVTIVDLLCEGPIAGFVNQNGSLISKSDSEEAVFLNDVPIRNAKKSNGDDGTRNYILNESGEDDIPILKLGDDNDELISKGISNTIDKDEPLYGASPYRDDGAAPHPYDSIQSAIDNGCKIFTHSIVSPDVDKVEFALRTSIAETNPSDGKTLVQDIHFAMLVVVDNKEYNLIELMDDNSTRYNVKSHDQVIIEATDSTRGIGRVNTEGNKHFKVRGIATSPYQFDLQITIGSVLGLDTRDIAPTFKIIKLSAELDPSVSDKNANPNAGVYIKRELGMSYVNEIISENLIYPHTACTLMKFDSKNFSQIPKRSYHVKMKKVLVPSNYDPESRIYDGPWDGTFKGQEKIGEEDALDSIKDSDKQWTDNPAWIFFDLVRDPRFGLGKYGLNETNIDKWQLYSISKYCDELVDTDYPIETTSGQLIPFNQVIKLDGSDSDFFEVSLQDSGLTEGEFTKMFGNNKSKKGMKIAFFIYQFTNPDGFNIEEATDVLYEKSKNRSGEIKIEQRVLEERREGTMTLVLKGKDFSQNSAAFDFDQDFAAYINEPGSSDLLKVYVNEQQSGASDPSGFAQKTQAQFGENHWWFTGPPHGRHNTSRTPPPSFSDGIPRKKVIGACAPQINHAIVEPRFSANFYLTERSEALQMINMIAATFRGIVSYLDGRITAIQDRPKKTSMIFNNSNVSEQGFNYSGIEKTKKTSSVLVRFNNQEKSFKPDVVYEEDADAIKSFGLIQTEVAAQGITSISAARRYAKWILLTSQVETETVNFKTSKEASFLTPGSIIEISDELRAGKDKSGRVLGVNMQDKNGKSKPRVFIDKLANFSPSFKKIEFIVSAGMSQSTQQEIQSRSSFENSSENQEADIENLQTPQMLVFSGNIGVEPDSSNKGPQGQTTYIENLSLKLPISVDVSTNTIKCNNHGFSEGDKVKFISEGVLPAGLSERKIGADAYFLHDVTKNTFKVHLKQEGDVNIIDKGKDFLLNPSEEHFVSPERSTNFSAYVDSYDDLLNAFSNQSSLTKEQFGKDHYFNNGESENREVPLEEESFTFEAISQIQIGATYILKGLFDSGRVLPSELEDNEALIREKLLISQTIADGSWKVSEFFGIMYLMSNGWGMIKIGGDLKWVYFQAVIDRTSENCWFWSSDLDCWIWFDDRSPDLWYIHDEDESKKCYLEVVRVDGEIMFLIAIDHRTNNSTLFMKPTLNTGDIFTLKIKIDFEVAKRIDPSSGNLGGYVLFNQQKSKEITPPDISSGVMQEILAFSGLGLSNLQENPSYKSVQIQEYIVVEGSQSISGDESLQIVFSSSHDVDFRNNYEIVIKDFQSSDSSKNSIVNEVKIKTIFVNENSVQVAETGQILQDIITVIKDTSLTIVNHGRIELFENAKSVSQRMYEAQKFRVLSIKENDDATFEINGLEYNPSKFSAADKKGIVRKPVLPIPPQVDMGVPEEPRNLILTDLTLR